MKLKPCPFCGGQPGVRKAIEWLVMCDWCFESNPGHFLVQIGHRFKKEAIRIWNRRAGNKKGGEGE